MNYHNQVSLYSFILISIFSINIIYCQEQLELSLSHACLYSTNEYPEELYAFTQDSTVESIKNDILAVTKIQENFVLLSSNVETIAAIVDRDKRYILYSRKYFNTISKTEKAVLIAHAIGHHSLNHNFRVAFKSDEDIEADEFMGFALNLLGYNLGAIMLSVAQLPLKDTDTLMRKMTITSGYQRGEVLLKNSQHAAFNEKEINEVLRNMPVFHLPPPIPSAEANLDGYFSNCKTIGQVDKLILDALNNTGYYSKKYYYTEGGGYAIVTKMEQFNKDGSCMQDNARWTTKPIRNEDFSVTNYLKSLFIPEPGFFRVIVFVVSPNYYGDNSGDKTNKEGVLGWLEHGYTSLPSVIGSKPFNKQVQVHGLVYEFKMLLTDKKYNFSKPSGLDGTTHLQMARILANLKR